MKKYIGIFLIGMALLLLGSFVISITCDFFHFGYIIRFGLSIILGYFLGRWFAKKYLI